MIFCKHDSRKILFDKVFLLIYMFTIYYRIFNLYVNSLKPKEIWYMYVFI